MNERIRLLAEQAGIIPGIMGVNRFTHFDPEKFAELIVRECSEIVLNCGIIGSNNERDFIVASREIKQHFGIKE